MELTLFLTAVLGFTVSFTATLVATPRVAGFMRRHGVVGVDYHKLSRPKIPEMGGLAMILGLILALCILPVLDLSQFWRSFSFILLVLSVSLIGILDDLRGLNARVKPLLTGLAGFVPVALNLVAKSKLYAGYLAVPFGKLRITILYNLLLPAGIAIASNAMNMCDPVNGVMSGSASIISATLLIASLVSGKLHTAPYAAAVLGCSFAFYIYNRYPAKVFPGDVGTLTMGAALAYTAVLGGLEFVALTSMLTQILNGLFTLLSLGRLLERREMPARPTYLLRDERIAASLNPAAPLTLTRMLTAAEPLTEKEVASSFFKLTIFSCILALASLPLLPGGVPYG